MNGIKNKLAIRKPLVKLLIIFKHPPAIKILEHELTIMKLRCN